MTLQSLASEYRHAKSDVEKRDICMKAIDAGVIDRGVDLEVLVELCGNDFDLSMPTAVCQSSSGTAIVDFQPPTRIGEMNGQLISGAYFGWYMVVQHANGKIVRYDFSNLHK